MKLKYIKLPVSMAVCRVLLLICVLLFANSCKKDDYAKNITLYNKSVPTIKSYISGRWRVIYDIGGMTGKIKHEYVNSYMEFKFQSVDSIIEFNDNKTVIRSSLQWLRDKDVFTGETINLLGFNFYQTGLAFTYRVSEIRDDSLIITEPVVDGFSLVLCR